LLGGVHFQGFIPYTTFTNVLSRKFPFIQFLGIIIPVANRFSPDHSFLGYSTPLMHRLSNPSEQTFQKRNFCGLISPRKYHEKLNRLPLNNTNQPLPRHTAEFTASHERKNKTHSLLS
jgi:hypothetical protein